jgi:hypothetical protein
MEKPEPNSQALFDGSLEKEEFLSKSSGLKYGCNKRYPNSSYLGEIEKFGNSQIIAPIKILERKS